MNAYEERIKNIHNIVQAISVLLEEEDVAPYCLAIMAEVSWLNGYIEGLERHIDRLQEHKGKEEVDNDETVR